MHSTFCEFPGFQVVALARSRETVRAIEDEQPSVHGVVCDVADPDSVKRTFDTVRADFGDVHSLLYNAGSGIFEDFYNTTPEHFEHSWRVNAYGAFLCAKQVIPAMRAAGSGNIIFIGATASRRGAAKTSAFAPAKAAQRSLAESLARSFWPHGIHVALIVVDGLIASAAGAGSERGLIDPAGIAETAYQLSQQDKSAWSFEVEARSYLERW